MSGIASEDAAAVAPVAVAEGKGAHVPAAAAPADVHRAEGATGNRGNIEDVPGVVHEKLPSLSVRLLPEQLPDIRQGHFNLRLTAQLRDDLAVGHALGEGEHPSHVAGGQNAGVVAEPRPEVLADAGELHGRVPGEEGLGRAEGLLRDTHDLLLARQELGDLVKQLLVDLLRQTDHELHEGVTPPRERVRERPSDGLQVPAECGE